MNNHLSDINSPIKLGHDKKILLERPWVPEIIENPNNIPKGDMPGDKIVISPDHIKKAHAIFPGLLEILVPILNDNQYRRAVVAVCGGSGVGKSEIASLLSHYLNSIGLNSYTLSGDNYPHRIPRYNDAERLRIFRHSGIRGLIAHGEYTDGRQTIIRELQKSGRDADQDYTKIYHWLSIYQSAGRCGLKNYLGTPAEIDFDELTGIITQFKNGRSQILLKRMGREETEFWYESVDFSDGNVLLIEWTHGNNHNLFGVDIPILLNSTPQETLEHRKSRNRDGNADSPFTTMVLELEQDILFTQASRAKLIVSKNGEILTFRDYAGLMMEKRQEAGNG
ncbi:MAG TPA: adenylylsulfate kinase [Clostridia bacterium]|nr:adenylylsulfate kinase [Clostridia bacterium]